jgi:hypothetical protein
MRRPEGKNLFRKPRLIEALNIKWNLWKYGVTVMNLEVP